MLQRVELPPYSSRVRHNGAYRVRPIRRRVALAARYSQNAFIKRANRLSFLFLFTRYDFVHNILLTAATRLVRVVVPRTYV